MKYKVGDKFLKEIEVGLIVEGDSCPYKMLPYGAGWREAALDALRRPDDMTADEAWEIARKLILHPDNGGYTPQEVEEIFGTHSSTMIFRNNTPRQAKAQIDAWEAKKEIKVGDEVTPRENDSVEHRFFVTYKGEDEIGGFSGFNGEVFSCRDIDRYIRTGRHIDIQIMLDQIGGAE